MYVYHIIYFDIDIFESVFQQLLMCGVKIESPQKCTYKKVAEHMNMWGWNQLIFNNMIRIRKNANWRN